MLKRLKRLLVSMILLCSSMQQVSAIAPGPDSVPGLSQWYTNFVGGGLGGVFMWEYTDYAQPGTQAQSKSDAQGIIKSGKFPTFDMAWDPPKNSSNAPSGPGFDQWLAWKDAHQQYYCMDDQGNPHGDYYSDAISACMPYDSVDWPAGVKNGTRNDWEKPRVLGFAVAIGATGYFSADKYDNGWNWDMTTLHWDFNPRIIDAFAKKLGVTIPGNSISERAAVIKDKYFSEWTDYFCEGNAIRHTQILQGLKESGIVHPMNIFQIDFNVTANRIKGMDMRMMGARSQFGEILKHCEMQVGDGRTPMDKSACPSFFGLWAARAPNVMHGSMLSSNTSGTTGFYGDAPKVFDESQGDIQDWGGKYMKTQWLSVGWWQIATIDGSVRRALCETEKSYWDAGSLPENVQEFVRAYKPVKPFGLAFYYSVPVERIYESQYPKTNKLYPMTGGYSYEGGKAQEAQHFGIPVGYSVSDTALYNLQPRNFPTGWLTTDVDKMPAAELAKLQSIAPVYDLNTVDMATIPSPIKFSQGACGYAFEDQNNESIFLIWRQGGGIESRQQATAGNTAMNCVVSFDGIKEDGTYSITDLFDTSIKSTVTITNGRGSFDFTLDKWDCRAFKCDMLSPNSVATDAIMVRRNFQPAHVSMHHGIIRAAVTTTGRLTLRLMDANGKQAALIIDRDVAPGSYSSNFANLDLANGNYIAVCRINDIEKRINLSWIR